MSIATPRLFLKYSTRASPTSPTEKLPEHILNIPLTESGASTAAIYQATASLSAKIGRQILGLLTVILFSVRAFMYIVFTIRSKRILELYPEMVPLRKLMTENV